MFFHLTQKCRLYRSCLFGLAWNSSAVVLVVLATSLFISMSSAEAGIKQQFGLQRPSSAQFFYDYDDGGPVVDSTFSFGNPGDVALLADVDGDTIADPILYRQGVWFIDLRAAG